MIYFKKQHEIFSLFMKTTWNIFTNYDLFHLFIIQNHIWNWLYTFKKNVHTRMADAWPCDFLASRADSNLKNYQYT